MSIKSRSQLEAQLKEQHRKIQYLTQAMCAVAQRRGGKVSISREDFEAIPKDAHLVIRRLKNLHFVLVGEDKDEAFSWRIGKLAKAHFSQEHTKSATHKHLIGSFWWEK